MVSTQDKFTCTDSIEIIAQPIYCLKLVLFSFKI